MRIADRGNNFLRPGGTASRLTRVAQTALLALPFLPSTAWAAEEQTGNSVTTPVLDLAQTTSLAMTALKVFGALLFTVGIMLLIAVWARKLGLSRAGLRQGRLINILDTKMIAPKKYVAVVRIAEKTLALGITDQQITLLSPLENREIPVAANSNEERPQTPFSTLLGRTIKRAKR